MKKIALVLSIFWLLMCVFPGASGSQKDKYRRWLNEDVYWLITPEEENAFKNLKSDKERDRFIALFWARRDPAPLTETNELREAHYSRLAYVNRKYTRAQDMGWKTDVGKILIFFGLPRERKTNPETWIYDPIPFLKLTEEFSVIFDLSEETGLVLNQRLTSPAALEAMDNYARLTVFHPDLKELPDFSKTKIPPALIESKKILDQAAAEPSGQELPMGIPLETAVLFSKAEEKKTSLSIVFFLDPRESKIKEAVLFGRIKTSDGGTEDFWKEVRLKDDDYYVENRIPLLPRSYDILFGLRDSKSGRVSLLRKTIDIPDLWLDRLAVGNLVVTDRVEPAESGRKDNSAFNFGQFMAFPKKDAVFKKTDTLNVLFHIYNARAENGRVKLVQDIRLKSASRTFRLPPSTLENEVPPGQVVVAGFPIPLTQIGPGEYEVLIAVTDRIGQQAVETSARVVIVE